MFDLFKKKEKKPENFEELVLKLQGLENNLKKVTETLEQFNEKSKSHIQKIGIVRFNPFTEVGGDQSFAVALLDDDNNGFIITGLYTREGNRVYAKPVVNGKSKYFLSDEEKEAIKKAIG